MTTLGRSWIDASRDWSTSVSSHGCRHTKCEAHCLELERRRDQEATLTMVQLAIMLIEPHKTGRKLERRHLI
jgi:hypothetical protein